jgi:hypothetical protein
MTDVYAAPAAEAIAAGEILEILTSWRGDPPFESLEEAAKALAPIDGARARLVLDQVYTAAVALGLRASVAETYVGQVALLSDLKFYFVTDRARHRATVAAGMTVDVALARNTGITAS